MHFLKTGLICMLLLGLTACTAGVTEAGVAPLNIVCTSFPCYDFARAVAGDAGDVRMLIKPGSEVHSYEPTPADVMEIAECDLFVYIGGESDAWVGSILDSFGADAPRTLRLFDCVEALEEEIVDSMTVAPAAESGEGETEYDEHIWTSPVNAERMVNAVSVELQEIDATQADSYAENAAAYAAQIETIDAAFRETVETGSRREIVFADRFPFLYFVREYGLDYCAAFPSCSSESEPSAKTIAYLIDRIVSDQIPVIYTLEMSTGKTAETIAEETGAEILTFYSVQTVSEQDFANGETYLSLMQKNVEALKKGLN